MSYEILSKVVCCVAVLFLSVVQAEINWTEHVIDSNFDEAWAVYSCDFDNDLDMDIIACSKGDGVAWYENDGEQYFTKHVIDDEISNICAVMAVDMDGDEDLDVLAGGVGSGYNGVVAWYENDGDMSFTPYTITTDLSYCQYAEAADIDSDGDMDVLAVGSWSYEIVWFENDGEQNFTENSIIDDYSYCYFATAVDFDQDEDIDIVASGAYEEITWFENNGEQIFTEHAISNIDTCFSTSLAIVDIDGDNDLDIIAPDLWRDQIMSFINDGEFIFLLDVIDYSYNGAYDITAADIDNDNDLDLVGAAWDDATVTWWEHNNDDSYTRYDLTSDYPYARRARPADIDGDGALDIVATSQYDDKIAWWESDLYTSIDDDTPDIPREVSLICAYPNPFNASTTIAFDLNSSTQVKIDIYDLQGRKLTTLMNEYKQAGSHNVIFDASDYASGIYFYRLQAGDFSESKRIVLLK